MLVSYSPDNFVMKHLSQLDERFRVAGRSNFYETVDEMEKDFRVYIKFYNSKRSHQGRNMNGRTPYQVFQEGIRELKMEEDQ